MFKQTGTSSFHATCLGFILAILIIALTLAAIQAGTACTNEKGCAKRWCPVKELKSEGKRIIESNAGICEGRNPETIT